MLSLLASDFHDKHMMKLYAVVEFTDDCSVEVAPCIWVEGNICFWPPYRNERLVNAIKKCEEPQPSWLKYTVRVLHLFGERNEY